MKEKQNVEKAFKKAIESAKKLSTTLEKDIGKLRSEEKEAASHRDYAKNALKAWQNNKQNNKNASGAKQAKTIDAWKRNYKYSIEDLYRSKTEADEKTAQKKVLDETIKKLENTIDINTDISNKSLLAAAKHLNKMIDLIDPPFNYKKLPGILFLSLGALILLTVVFGSFILAFIPGIPALMLSMGLLLPITLGGVGIATIGAVLLDRIVENDSDALRGCKKLMPVGEEKEFPSVETLDKSTVYYKMNEDETIETRWHENNGTEAGIIKENHINDKVTYQEILELIQTEDSSFFDSMVSLLGYSSPTVQALSIEANTFTLAKAIPTELTNVVGAPSPSSTSSTAAGKEGENKAQKNNASLDWQPPVVTQPTVQEDQTAVENQKTANEKREFKT